MKAKTQAIVAWSAALAAGVALYVVTKPKPLPPPPPAAEIKEFCKTHQDLHYCQRINALEGN